MEDMPVGLPRVIVVLLALCIAMFVSIYMISSAVLPFFIAFVLAYLLAPSVDILERKFRIPRTFGSIIVLLGGFCVFILLSLLIIPATYTQIMHFADLAMSDQYKPYLLLKDNPLLLDLNARFGDIITDNINEVATKIMAFAGAAIKEIFQTGFAAVNVLSIIFITPIILFYMLKDWTHLVNAIHSLVPRKLIPNYQELLNNMDRTLSGYVRGQALDCLFMATYYAIAYEIIGLNFALALAVIAGLTTFVPFVGVMFSGSLAILVAIGQFGAASEVLIVIGLIVVANIIEGNFIVPKLIGERIEVHPAWVMFGLLAGGALFGFWGVLLALPLTALISVVIKFALKAYKVSELYN